MTHRGLREEGTASEFLKARADFEAAWTRLSPRITEADLTEYRRERAWMAWKEKMWRCGCKLPAQEADGGSRCFCGLDITNASMSDHVRLVHLD
jgi:hypothetical protein